MFESQEQKSILLKPKSAKSMGPQASSPVSTRFFLKPGEAGIAVEEDVG